MTTVWGTPQVLPTLFLTSHQPDPFHFEKLLHFGWPLAVSETTAIWGELMSFVFLDSYPPYPPLIRDSLTASTHYWCGKDPPPFLQTCKWPPFCHVDVVSSKGLLWDSPILQSEALITFLINRLSLKRTEQLSITIHPSPTLNLKPETFREEAQEYGLFENYFCKTHGLLFLSNWTQMRAWSFFPSASVFSLLDQTPIWLCKGIVVVSHLLWG